MGRRRAKRPGARPWRSSSDPDALLAETSPGRERRNPVTSLRRTEGVGAEERCRFAAEVPNGPIEALGLFCPLYAQGVKARVERVCFVRRMHWTSWRGASDDGETQLRRPARSRSTEPVWVRPRRLLRE